MAAAAFDDTRWANVTLPHSFNATDGEQADYYRGPAWYRRSFNVARIDPERRMFVAFGAAATQADIFLNGVRIGSHRGGHAAFRLDLTPALKAGRNVLAVRVDNRADQGITPLGGDFTVFGGLYRDVALIETDEVHFDLLDHGGPGLAARTLRLSNREAAINVRARIVNDGAEGGRFPLTVRLYDSGGRVVATAASTIELAGQSVGERSVPLRLVSPHRWDGVRDPYLYRIEAQIGGAGGGDTVTIPFGVRSIEIDPGRGLILNDRPYPLHGVNLMHSARPGRGTAVGEREIDEDFAILREMGATGVRLVHFQHPEAAYAAADRLGLVVWTEIGMNGKVAPTAAFAANAVEQMRELVAQTRNHPSVAMYGVGNEVHGDDAEVLPVLTAVRDAARMADPDRPTVYAHCCQADDAPKARLTDLVGFNRYFGWYAEQRGSLGDWAAGFHAAHPGTAFALSEYGAGASIAHQEDPPRPPVTTSGWHPEQYQAIYHERNWREIRDKPYVFGKFVWVAFDLASGGRNEGGQPGINDKGLVTYDRQVRKDAWYWYQANWSDMPMLHLTGKRYRERTAAIAEVKAYTNGEAVTLTVNGRRVGTQTPNDHIVRWKIPLTSGVNRIVVEQQAAGRTLRDEAEWIFSPDPQQLVPE